MSTDAGASTGFLGRISKMRSRKVSYVIAVVFLLAAVSPLFVPAYAAAKKITIGAVEEVMLLPWGVQFPARVDTGAATSSIDVCEIAVKGKEVHFTLANRCGGHRLVLPLLEMRHIQTSEGGDERPVVEMELCIGSRRIVTPVTLNDRSLLEFPFLVGRNILEGNFVVDVSRSRTASPTCPLVRLP